MVRGTGVNAREPGSTLESGQVWRGTAILVRMSRPLRVEFPGAVYHVMARGNERRTIFKDDWDRELWQVALEEMLGLYGVRAHCFCLMGNHYHLVLETPLGNRSEAMAWLQTTFTVRYNRAHRRSGHLFQGRFKAELVEADDYAQGLLRYVHLNPVRVGVRGGEPVPGDRREALEAYRWSSHRVYLGKEKKPEWLCGEWLGYFGDTVRVARRGYRNFVLQAFADGVESPREQFRGGLVLGGDELWEKVSGLLRERSGEAEANWVRDAVESTDMREWARERARTVGDVRMKAWIMAVLGRVKRVEVARELGYRDGSAVTHLLKRLERIRKESKETAAAMRSHERAYDSSFKR